MKKILIIVAIAFSFSANAQQVSKINLQASGLTCSMCSNAIYKALKTLDFVEKITPNISNSTFDIAIKQNAVVDFDKVKAKVEDAGFAVAKLIATINFTNTSISNDQHINVGSTTFHFLNAKSQVLNGNKEIRLLDKGYVSAREYKKNGALTKMECYKTGVAGACCAKDNLPEGKRIFHVTI